ncbi:MAG: aspartate aminotransferase family protein, partial [Deltaproteobacteria bacterium]
TCLAAARQAVLARAGWDVGAQGLIGAPRIAVIAGDEAHVTVHGALRLLGLGDACVVKVKTDGQGRVLSDALRDALRNAAGAPAIVCAQAGNVNTGSFDPLGEITRLAGAHGNAWVHVDGAFGLWAGASARFRHLLDGVSGADSWATDAHKWLNVPYDSGLAFVRDTAAHRAAMARTAAYLQRSSSERDNYEWTPEFSRRARGFTVYAALRSLGRAGLAALVERCCDHARLFAERLSAAPRVSVVNEVVLNQVLVRFERPGSSVEEADAWTREVISRVQRDGTCWLSGTVWRGRALMRISVCNWGDGSQAERDDDIAEHGPGPMQPVHDRLADLENCKCGETVAHPRHAWSPSGHRIATLEALRWECQMWFTSLVFEHDDDLDPRPGRCLRRRGRRLLRGHAAGAALRARHRH